VRKQPRSGSPNCALAFELRAETIDIGELEEFLFDGAEVRLEVIEAIRT
jgi:hypothetical protein